MDINTKQVKGRREVQYASLSEVVADARRIAQAPQVTPLGNWSPGQIFDHLAKGIDLSIDGANFKVFFLMRWVGTALLKKNLLEKGMPAGFPTNPQFEPDPVDTDTGLARLVEAIARYQQETYRAPHPFFGKLTPEEWTRFHLRHCEMHMSFLVLPKEASQPVATSV